MLTNGTEVEEDSDEVSESYEPPEELHQSQRDERYRPNEANRSNGSMFGVLTPAKYTVVKVESDTVA